MKQWLKKHLKPYMIRPTVYKAFSYFLTALVVVLFWNRFVNKGGSSPMSHAYTILGMFFFAAAWFNYLRLDGIKISVMSLLPIGTPKKRASGPFSDMSDHIDTEVVSFQELGQEERDTCCLLANIICGVVFFFLSLV